MPNALVEAVASSSAHGISRAAGTRAAPLKVMWILLFTLFLAMFLKSGISLVLKLRENKLTKTYHLDQVPFVFPDLYFCPNNPFSGSYPFMLTEAEAGQVNSAISRIIREYKKVNADFLRFPEDAAWFTLFVQMSFPFHLTVKHLAVRKEQSVLKAKLYSDYRTRPVEMKPFYHPENLICFKAELTDEMRRMMMSVNSILEIWLTTDPYFTDFNFTGHPIDPIVDDTNQSVSFLDWHPTLMVEKMKVSGYAMLVVPPGTYPFLRFEDNFQLAPGNSYSVKLQMEENACSEELHETYCIADHPAVAFRDPLTRQPEYFSYSGSTCYYQSRNRELINEYGCHMSGHPTLWMYNDRPQCWNVSEMTPTTAEQLSQFSMAKSNILNAIANKYCQSKVPCSYPEYSTSYSFGKWPGIGSSTDHFFANSVQFNETEAPALAKLVTMAKQMQGESHSVHLENIFRSYVTESLISVSISSASVMSPQVMLTWAYSMPYFLVDIGGLLGLYIGCSVLTLCEMLELLYVLVGHVFRRRGDRAEAVDASAAN